MRKKTVVILKNSSVWLINATREQVVHNLRREGIKPPVVEEVEQMQLREFLEAFR